MLIAIGTILIFSPFANNVRTVAAGRGNTGAGGHGFKWTNHREAGPR